MSNWVTSLSYSSNHSVTPMCPVWIVYCHPGGHLSPIRTEIFPHRTKVITLSNTVLICGDPCKLNPTGTAPGARIRALFRGVAEERPKEIQEKLCITYCQPTSYLTFLNYRTNITDRLNHRANKTS